MLVLCTTDGAIRGTNVHSYDYSIAVSQSTACAAGGVHRVCSTGQRHRSWSGGQSKPHTVLVLEGYEDLIWVRSSTRELPIHHNGEGSARHNVP